MTRSSSRRHEGPGRRARRPWAVLAVMALAGLAVPLARTLPAAAGGTSLVPGTTSYSSPGSYTYVVPTGVTTLAVDMAGASGGTRINVVAGDLSGLGGTADAVISVTAGETIYLNVGGDDGFNGGGVSGSSAGGGASDIRVGGTSLSNRVVTAGGGGGAGVCLYCAGGSGGAIGSPGTPESDLGFSYLLGGSGGTLTGGGAGGTGIALFACGPVNLGQAGSLGQGGAGGGAGGGGGGAGYYGGGGGASDTGCPDGAGGGGGSSWGPVATTFGTQALLGNGYVNLTPVSAPSVTVPPVTVPPVTTPPVTTPPVTVPSLPPGAYPSDDCDAAGTNVVSGFVDGLFTKLKTAPGGTNVTWVCLAAEAGGEHVGGKLILNAAAPGTSVGGVDLDANSVAACGNNANNTHVQGGLILGQPWFVDVTPSPAGSTDSAWVCVRLTNSVGVRLRLAPGVSVGLPNFGLDSAAPHSPAYTDAWPVASQPSSACKTAGGTRLVNVTVGSTPLAVYGWLESATKAHLCYREGTTGGIGGQLTVNALPSITGISTTNSTAPCPFPVFTANNPSFGLFTSNPGASLPASACVAIGSTALGITVNTPSVGPIVSLQQDSA